MIPIALQVTCNIGSSYEHGEVVVLLELRLLYLGSLEIEGSLKTPIPRQVPLQK